MKYKFILDCEFNSKEFMAGYVVEVVGVRYNVLLGLLVSIFLDEYHETHEIPLEMLKFCAKEVQ